MRKSVYGKLDVAQRRIIDRRVCVQGGCCRGKCALLCVHYVCIMCALLFVHYVSIIMRIIHIFILFPWMGGSGSETHHRQTCVCVQVGWC